MSDKNNKTKMDMPVLTERDVEILVGAVRCIEGGLPKPDLAKFAAMAGFANTNSAAVSLNLVKKKIMGEAPPPKTPRKALPSGKRKQSTPKTVDDDDMMEESPAKKAKTTPKKGGKKETAVKGEADDEGNAAFL